MEGRASRKCATRPMREGTIGNIIMTEMTHQRTWLNAETLTEPAGTVGLPPDFGCETPARTQRSGGGPSVGAAAEALEGCANRWGW